MPHYDEIFKHITTEFPQDLAVLALKTSEVEVGKRLSTEHATVRMHHSDMVFHVRLPDEEAILHIEAQTDDSTHKPMPLRMLAYSSFLSLEHQKNVYSTVLYFRPPAGQRGPGFYKFGNEQRGGGTFQYNVIRIYELEGEAFLDPDAVGLLPFTALMKTPVDMTPQSWVDKCAETIQTVDVGKEMRGTLMFALSLFGSFIHPNEFFQDPLLEAIMQESPFYEHVMQQGDERGYKRGIEQGERNNTVESILELLSIRFHIDTTEAIKSDIENIDTLQRLKQLRRAAAQVENLDAFMHILQNGSDPL